ncbi:antibiotic resistance protein MarC [Vibrio anguillarum]|uniref:UPF0056 membrane protein n=3 Tax=Vibrio anguillarum TaxID=55601 RepID=A0AAW4ANZ9_VIBAN|nr:MarC family integral membrane protein [Vibrio anguillarum 775]AGU58713.1 hypothetical protein N175_00615 [Vibrio anguillarum M3]ARV25697.1 marC integral membrane family protein [Vibrio anguillarum]ASF90634.1 antibiotic resistance protein MarC [Vibrio anguillarum]ATA50705.1 antibiotic resistance protein MarC [Vibrio anguillarum]
MDILSAATMLFLIMDPLGNLPVMLSILKHLDPKRRRVVLVRELCFALIILMLFLFAGKNIMGFLHVQPETLSISGGIILFITKVTPKRIIFKLISTIKSSFDSEFGLSMKVLYTIFSYNIFMIGVCAPMERKRTLTEI